MGRNRNDSGGSSSYSQMRSNFTALYRKQIGRQEVKKNVKVAKEVTKRNDLKVNSKTLYKDISIMIGVLILFLLCFYIIFNVIVLELGDILPAIHKHATDGLFQ